MLPKPLDVICSVSFNETFTNKFHNKFVAVYNAGAGPSLLFDRLYYLLDFTVLFAYLKVKLSDFQCWLMWLRCFNDVGNKAEKKSPIANTDTLLDEQFLHSY
jgi:hypothetical protein